MVHSLPGGRLPTLTWNISSFSEEKKTMEGMSVSNGVH